MSNFVETATEAIQQQNWLLLLQHLHQGWGQTPAPLRRSLPPRSELTDDPATTALHFALTLLHTGDFQTRWEIAKVFPAFGAAAIAPLQQLLANSDADLELRWFAARILGELRHPAAAQALVVQLTELELTELDNEDLETTVIAALAQQGSVAIATLTQLLAGEATRLAAVRALAQIHHPEVLDPLLRVVTDEQAAIRATAIAALTAFPDPRIPAVLLAALPDSSEIVRREAVIGLGLVASRISPPEAFVLPLQARLSDLDLGVCQQAAIALGRLKTDPAATALFQRLQATTTPLSLRLDCIRALGWMATPQSLVYLRQALQLPLPETWYEIVTVLSRVESPALQPLAAEILIDLLESQHPATQDLRLKQSLALGLGHLGHPQALEPLVQLLSEPELSLRLHGIKALQQLDPGRAYQRLTSLAKAENLSPELQRGVAIALQEWTQDQ